MDVRNLSGQAWKRIADGLKRKSFAKCGKWSENCVVMGEPFPGKFSFEHHPWLEEISDPGCSEVTIMKGAQVGISTVALNRTCYNIDIRGLSVLYLLPSKSPDATDFSSTRFDPALELSPYLRGLFSDVKNVTTKRAGAATLYIRGANSRSSLKSIPVGMIVFDEYDEMPEKNIPLAEARTDGQRSSEMWFISTPIFPKQGIHKRFLLGTQEHFMFKCPGCSRTIELGPDNLKVYADNLINEADLLKSQIICTECKKVLAEGKNSENKKSFLTDGFWHKNGPADVSRSFYINQLYSMSKAGQPYLLAKAYLRGLMEEPAMQEWFNSKLGLPRLADGAKLDETQVLKCRRDHSRSLAYVPDGRINTMGVDVGTWLHVEIDSWDIPSMGYDINSMSRPKVLADIKVKNFEDLDKLMRDYNISGCVCDANPEGRKAVEFAKRFPGYVKLCYYGRDKAAKTIEPTKDGCDYKISVDRTSWMDLALGRFARDEIFLPHDVSNEYIRHICEPARLLRYDDTGNAVATWRNDGADHFAHARTYAELALPHAAAMMSGQPVSVFL